MRAYRTRRLPFGAEPVGDTDCSNTLEFTHVQLTEQDTEPRRSFAQDPRYRRLFMYLI